MSKLIPSVYRQDLSTKTSIYKWLLIGLLIRLSFMPFTIYYPDTLSPYWRGSLIAYHGMYGIVHQQVLIFWLHALFLKILKPLLPYFESILNDPNLGWGVTWKMWANFVQHPYAFRTLFLFKLPYLFFDLGSAFLLLFTLQEDKKGLNAFKFWMINPIVIFVTFVATKYDCIEVFFILLSIYYAKSKCSRRSLFWLGMSIAARFYPLMLLPLFVIILGKKPRQYLELSAWGLLPLGISTILSKIIIGTSEVGIVAGLHHINYLFSMKFYFGYLNSAIYIFVVLYVFLFLHTYYKHDHSFENLWKTCLISFLLFFATCFFHAQYFIWLMPFLAFQIVEDKRYVWLFVIMVICYTVYILQWPGMMDRFIFAPIDYSYFVMHMRSPYEIINQYYPADQFINVFRSILSAVLLWMVYLIVKKSSLKKRGI